MYPRGVALRPLRCRRAELLRLERGLATESSGARFLVVEGPRRTGKTFLLHHLLAGLPEDVAAVYFEATQAGERDQLRRFGEALTAALGADAPPMATISTWQQALAFCVYTARRRPLVVVLDEATYLTGSTPGFMSIVKSEWDRLAVEADQPALTLILTGSAVGLVHDALDHSGPLYGRPNDVIRLRPFTAAQASEFCGHPEPVAMFEAYSACGGYPLHLDAWDFDTDSHSNRHRLAGSPGGVLLEDASLLMATLPELHRRVLLAAGQGRVRRSELQNEAGGRIDRAVEALVRARFLHEARPIGAPLKARPEYRVDDAYLRYWFRCLSSGVQRIEAGQGAAVLQHTAEQWQNQLGWVFEQAARDHALHLVAQGDLPSGADIGEWWATSGGQVQIDVLGLLQHRTVITGEAKWSRQPLGPSVVDDLARKTRLAPDPVAQPQLLLWGRGGVRPEVQVGSVRGFGPADMLRR